MQSRHIAALVVALACFGCDDAEEEGLRVGTYNAGLAPGFVPFSAERAPLTIGAIADLPVDVACVQEVWTAADVGALVDATRDRWPNAIVPEPQPSTLPGGPACTPADLTALSTCVASACAGLPTQQIGPCAIAQCQTELAGLPDSCTTCLAASIGAPFETIQEACTTTPGPAFAFGGSFGLALLSRFPLLDQDVLVLESTLNRRAVIYARVEAEQVAAHVFCTHLTAVLDDIPYPGSAESWEAEQRAQIEALLEFVSSKTTEGDRIVLLGDLNTGPGFGDIDPVAEANYDLFLPRFRNPYIEETPNPLCTFCADNPLVPDDAGSSIIDHILVANLDADDTVQRVLTGEVEVDVDGTPTPVALSDHYGLTAALIE